ncbi:hypothetical protein DH2020_013140 [Rehmannia glutinosa]|uniref:PHD-type domain-containing protein n=1 Tax=Rehmannia glutinosa TaxID=99300 RepID=A0ABR0X1M0_REHGL
MHDIIYNSAIYTLFQGQHIVYHYSGNATIGPPDPYTEVKCSVCHGKADESLLLLCDLCDSAAHTYCVGLGATVPEGDWFCQDCTLLRDEHLKSETNTDSGAQISFDSIHKISSANEHVSVFDIVREPCDHAVQRSRTSTDDDNNMINNIDRPSLTSLETVAPHPTNPNARTLRQCRNLHDRIRVLRENWNGFRSGILNFSSSTGDGNLSNQTLVTCKSGRDSVSCLNQQSKAQCSSSDMTNDIGTHEIHKAWKMMDKAKSIKQDRQRSSIASQASKGPIRKLKTIRKADFMSYRHVFPDHQQKGSKNVESTVPGHNYYCSLEKDYYKQPSLVSGKQKWRKHMAKDVTNCSEGSIIGHSSKLQELKSSKGVRSEKVLAEKSFKGSACLSSSVVSEPVVLNVDGVQGVNHTSSSLSKAKHAKEKSKLVNVCVDGQQYNDAKSEIQSLVKLNLKLQTKEEKLEIDAFKEVARLATHSILGACGLEHPKPGSCSIPDFICSHSDQVSKSSPMPNACRECFYVFVKDMINTVMLHKKRT